jgi:hypothetical protein
VPAASGGVQVLVCEKSLGLVPVMAMAGMLSEAVPVLVSVAVCAELRLPIDCCAKVNALGANVAVVAPAEVATVNVTTPAVSKVASTATSGRPSPLKSATNAK